MDVAPQGGGLIASTILFLSLAWSGVDPQSAEAVYDIPYQVSASVLPVSTTVNSSEGLLYSPPFPHEQRTAKVVEHHTSWNISTDRAVQPAYERSA